ncbi:Regulator of G-protein signaling 4 [Paragonimus heterotremus]|uniref:Regulator of G-protein signaling 4 n=1 Tax=Paragonimus heterotremus TaxID=100268 RepID=A0A8J4TTE7_9TREM|nr:Regulator of G-protein signaling 4 [Paragonimus heterotremus]
MTDKLTDESTELVSQEECVEKITDIDAIEETGQCEAGDLEPPSSSEHSTTSSDVMRLVTSARSLLCISTSQDSLQDLSQSERGPEEDECGAQDVEQMAPSSSVIPKLVSTELVPQLSNESTCECFRSISTKSSLITSRNHSPTKSDYASLQSENSSNNPPSLTVCPSKPESPDLSQNREIATESKNTIKPQSDGSVCPCSIQTTPTDPTLTLSKSFVSPQCPRSPTHHFEDFTREDFSRNSTVAGLPELLSVSPGSYGQESGSGSFKKGKIGLSFFRQKPNQSSGQVKSVQMKELKRMIRAGKPSFEQIHNWRHSFETLLNDRFGLALFKDFLSTEFSDENIEFWIACQEYKQITNPKKLAMRAQKIFEEFIAVQANREVNLDSKTRLQTEADLANPTIHTLDNAQKRIQALMEKDSYRRFLRSEIYLTLYAEAREVAKATAASALAASLQDASSELDGAVLNLINSTSCNSPFSFLSSLGTAFNASQGTGLNFPGVAAAAATAEAGMNSIQDLQLLGLSTSRHMRNSRALANTAQSSSRKARLNMAATAGESAETNVPSDTNE